MTDAAAHTSSGGDNSLALKLTGAIQAITAVGLAVFIWRGDWENVWLTAAVMLLTLLPAFLFRRYRVIVPPEFQLVFAAFVFVSLFLGSARDYY